MSHSHLTTKATAPLMKQMTTLTPAQLTQITGGALNRSALALTASRNALTAANTQTSQSNDTSKGQWVSLLPQIICEPR